METRLSGSAFQILAAATGKARLLTVKSLKSGTTRRLVSEERRLERCVKWSQSRARLIVEVDPNDPTWSLTHKIIMMLLLQSVLNTFSSSVDKLHYQYVDCTVSIINHTGGYVVRCHTCDRARLRPREVMGLNPTNSCCVSTPTQRAIPPGSVNEYQWKLGSNGTPSNALVLYPWSSGFGWCPAKG